MTVEAGHPEELEKNIDDERIIGGDNELDVSGMTRALEAFVSAGGANWVSIIGWYSEQGVIESSLDRFFFLIIDLVFVDFRDADSAYFLRVQESKLDFRDLEPLAHGLSIILHDCWDYSCFILIKSFI